VYTERGPRGGCYLHEEYRNTLTQLTTEEIGALFLSSIQEPLKDLGLSDPLRGAVLKLTAALPEPRQVAQSRITERIMIDSPPGRGHARATEHLGVLYEATMNDQWVRVTFARPFDVLITRRIAPYGLVARSGRWFVVWSGEDGHHRVDRLARIRAAQAEDETFDRSRDFALRTFWTDWSNRQDASRPEFEVQLLVREDAVKYVEDQLGAREGVFYGVPAPAETWKPMTATFPILEEARRAILALGGAVEVVGPKPLRMSIRDFAEQICRTYRRDEV
jgi:predicted DNA-binding transcriptional regulator YafY